MPAPVWIRVNLLESSLKIAADLLAEEVGADALHRLRLRLAREIAVHQEMSGSIPGAGLTESRLYGDIGEEILASIRKQEQELRSLGLKPQWPSKSSS